MIILHYMFSETLNYLVQHLTNKHKIYWAQKCMILQIFVDTDYLLNYIGLKLLQPLQDLVHFLHFLLISINLFVLPNSFIVSGACKSSLYSSFILNTNLLLILLM